MRNQRTYDLMKYLEVCENGEWSAPFEYPFCEDERDDDNVANEEFFEWVETFVTGPYVALKENIYFSNEQDRNFFLLAYNPKRWKC